MVGVFALIYIAIGATAHFWVTADERFRERWPAFEFVASLGWGFGLFWFLFVLTWPIWGLILIAVWVAGNDKDT